MDPESAAPLPFSRFQLPGLNLPLNWTPHQEYLVDSTKYKYRTKMRETFPAQGEGKDLFRTALNDPDNLRYFDANRTLLPVADVVLQASFAYF
jgi:hypothetical protein